MSENNNVNICLLGDVIQHVILKPAKKGGKDAPYIAHTQKTGAAILQKMICKALSNENEGKCDAPSNIVIFPDYKCLDNGINEPQLISILEHYPRISSKEEDSNKPLRVKVDFYSREVIHHDREKLNSSEFMKTMFETSSTGFDSVADKKILVIYDRDSRLREFIMKNDNYGVSGSLNNPKEALQCLVQSATNGVVIAIRDNINDKWLTCLEKILSAKENSVHERSVVILTADALRKYGLNITEYGSIEQAIHEVVAYLDRDPIKQIIQKLCAHLIVVFREAAALLIHMKSSDGGSGSDHFCPNFDRSAQSNPRQYGFMPGKFSILLTAIVKYLVENTESQPDDWDLGAALRLGVAAYNDYFDRGFCEIEKDEKLLDLNLETAVRSDRCQHLKASTWSKKELFLSSLNFDITKTKSGKYIAGTEDHHWSRVDALFSYHRIQDKKKPVVCQDEIEDELLLDIVKHGLESVSRHTDKEKHYRKDQFPSAKITCPYAEFGKIKMIDEREILGFINLSKLISKYLGSPDWPMPLPIAVFGRPGSGKSFAVKEIINSDSPGRKSEPLTFNLAQFSSVDQLTEAFHQVHDQALSSNEVPLVIFDEFDSSFHGWLGWLKFFLAPMQDGLFRGKTSDYRVGRAIFLFSGGTAHNFEQFKDQAPYAINEGSSITTRKEAKLDDFIGRLRGYLNVLGTDGENDLPPDRLVKLRRAILLRSLLEKDAEPILRFNKERQVQSANIRPDVVKAFLRTKNYNHGVRSMEAIIQMSRWINGEFVAASLPSPSQLQIHVDLESFGDLLHATSSTR